MSQEDEFMEIIQSNNLESLNFTVLTIADLHVGLRHLAASMVVITDLLHDFFEHFEQEDERPTLNNNTVVYAKDMFAAAEKFCIEFYGEDYNSIDDDDDDDDDEYDDDDDDMEEDE